METAKIIPMKRSATWEGVRTEYSKMTQMGWQAVVQAAAVGAMLIELKAAEYKKDDDGFVQRTGQEIGVKRAQAFNLMRLAANMALLEQHRPESQAKALELIAEHGEKKKGPREEGPKRYRVSWAQLLRDRFGLRLLGGAQATRIKKELDPPSFFTDPEEAEKFILRYVAAFPEKKDAPAPDYELPAPSQKKLDRAIKVELAKLQGSYQRQVCEAAAKMVPEMTAREKENYAEALEQGHRYAILLTGVKKKITMEEYKFLMQLLHPDRAPEGYGERFSRAFQLIMRLKDYAEL